VTKITVEGTPWLAELAAAVAADDPARAIEVLEARTTAHAGTPPSAEKTAAAAVIRRQFDSDPDGLVRWAVWTAEQPGPTAKELGALMLTHTYPQHKEEALHLLQRLAGDVNSEVREWAGSAAGELLSRHFKEMHPVLVRWASDRSELVRRAVAIAVRGVTDSRRPERCDALFELIEPLVSDRAEYVRQNTGPFAVGKMLHHYPEATLRRVREWASRDDEMSRWNAAMVFVSAAARNHVDSALDILSELARDERRLVRTAVASALRNLAKRDPGRVVPVLQKWLADDRKVPAALALRTLTPGPSPVRGRGERDMGKMPQPQ
jgi:3-methyladenine DNA glycosylase AlkC